MLVFYCQVVLPIIDWVSIADDYLTFAHKAYEYFQSDDIDAQKNVLRCLGSNLMLLGKKLIFIKPNIMLNIEKSFLAYCLENERFQHEKTPILQGVSPRNSGDNRARLGLCAG